MCKMRFLGCVLAILVLTVLSASCRRSLCRQPDQEEWSLLLTGDLVFCVGHSAQSSAVRLLSLSNNDGYSHVGFIVKTSDKAGVICHMSADDKCITQESLDSYIQKSNVTKMSFYRLPSPIDTVRLKYVFDSMIAKNVPFDAGFNFSTDDKLYCTEFIIKVLRKADNHDMDGVDTTYHIYPNDLIRDAHLHLLYDITDSIR